MAILRFYSTDAFHSSRLTQLLNALQEVNKNVFELKTELCYHVEVSGPFAEEKIAVLQWILKEPQQVKPLNRTSVWESAATNGKEFIIEIGPRFVFEIPIIFYIINYYLLFIINLIHINRVCNYEVFNHLCKRRERLSLELK